jgi:hypothetical protein
VPPLHDKTHAFNPNAKWHKTLATLEPYPQKTLNHTPNAPPTPLHPPPSTLLPQQGTCGAGDILLAINGQMLERLSRAQAAAALRGQPGSSIAIEVMHVDARHSVTRQVRANAKLRPNLETPETLSPTWKPSSPGNPQSTWKPSVLHPNP